MNEGVFKQQDLVSNKKSVSNFHTILINFEKWAQISIRQLGGWRVNPFKPEFTIDIFIRYKSQIAVAFLDLHRMKMTKSGGEWK